MFGHYKVKVDKNVILTKLLCTQKNRFPINRTFIATYTHVILTELILRIIDIENVWGENKSV